MSNSQAAVRPVEPTRKAGRVSYIPNDPLLTAREAAAERAQALSTFWRDVSLGRVPPAIYVTERRPRWRRSEIIAGLEAKRANRP